MAERLNLAFYEDQIAIKPVKVVYAMMGGGSDRAAAETIAAFFEHLESRPTEHAKYGDARALAKSYIDWTKSLGDEIVIGDDEEQSHPDKIARLIVYPNSTKRPRVEIQWGAFTTQANVEAVNEILGTSFDISAFPAEEPGIEAIRWIRQPHAYEPVNAPYLARASDAWCAKCLFSKVQHQLYMHILDVESREKKSS